MRSNRVLRWCLLLVALVALGGGIIALAADGPEFAGFYSTADEVESGDYVTLTFSTRVFNYTGADIVGATVRLESVYDLENPPGAFSGVDIVANGSVRLSRDLTVTVWDRNAWNEGATPYLTVEYQDAAGNTIRRPADLLRDCVIGEVQP